jgi:hypothetical protein
VKRVLIGAAVFASLAAAPSASSSTRPTLHVRPTTVSPGARVHVFGNADGCRRGDTVTVISRAFTNAHTFAGLGAILARVQSGGTFSGYGHVRRNAHVGRYSITARCGGGNFGVVVYLRVH